MSLTSLDVRKTILKRVQTLYDEYLSLNSYLDETGGYFVAEGLDLSDSAEDHAHTSITLRDGRCFFPVVNAKYLRYIWGHFIGELDLTEKEKGAVHAIFSECIEAVERHKTTPSPTLPDKKKPRCETPPEEHTYFLSLFEEKFMRLVPPEAPSFFSNTLLP